MGEGRGPGKEKGRRKKEVESGNFDNLSSWSDYSFMLHHKKVVNLCHRQSDLG